MNLLEQIKDVFSLSDEAEKENIIEKIGDLFEYGNLEKNEVIDVVNLLLSYVVHEKNGTI